LFAESIGWGHNLFPAAIQIWLYFFYIILYGYEGEIFDG